MSSNMKILKTCEFCKCEFIAKKTTTKTCSHRCGQRLYKLNLRNDKVAQAELKEQIKRKPKAFITEEEMTVIQVKEHLTLKEAALLLNITPLTLRRWVFAGKVNSRKAGKKHNINRSTIENVIEATNKSAVLL
jgi:excisionase family DNA binding protein